MAKVVSQDIAKFYHHYPRVAVVVTAHARGRDNAMAAAWHMPISVSPPLYVVSISPKRFTYQLIVDSGEFGVNFLALEAAKVVASVGGSHGRQIDKFQRFNIERDKPVSTAVPILKAAYAAYECRLVDDRSYGDHHLLVGEIAMVHWLEDAFTPDGILDLTQVSPALYLGHEVYLTASKDSSRSLDRKVYGKLKEE